MRKNILIVGITIVASISSFFLGTAQAREVVREIVKVETVEKKIETIPDCYIDTNSADFYNTYLDMQSVVGYSVGEQGILLRMEDGSGYYLEIGQEIE